MTIIDRYLLRQFFQTFLICFLSLLGLFIVFHAFTNLETFLKIAQHQGGLARVMGAYYARQAILFFDMSVGFVNLTAAMYTVTWIQRHNELVALMAAGVPRVRAAVPVVAAVTFVIVLAVLNREMLIPRFREELSRKPHDMALDTPRPFSPQYDERTDILIRGQGAVVTPPRARSSGPCSASRLRWTTTPSRSSPGKPFTSRRIPNTPAGICLWASSSRRTWGKDPRFSSRVLR